MQADRPRLVIIDDHEAWCHGLEEALRLRPGAPLVVYAGPDLTQAIDAVTRPGSAAFALIDAHLADGRASVPVVRSLRDRGVPVVAMTAHAEPEVICSLMSAGASGCITKAEVLRCLDEVSAAAMQGHLYVTPVLTASLLAMSPSDRLDSSWDEVLHWHAAGVPMDVILERHRLEVSNLEGMLRELIASLPPLDHGTNASSSSTAGD